MKIIIPFKTLSLYHPINVAHRFRAELRVRDQPARVQRRRRRPADLRNHPDQGRGGDAGSLDPVGAAGRTQRHRPLLVHRGPDLDRLQLAQVYDSVK